MYPHELRLHILQALSDWAHSGDSSLPEAWQLAESLGVSLHDILDQFDILEVGGAVDVARVGGDRGTTALITGVGKRMVEEAQQSQNHSFVHPSSSEDTSKALELFEQVASDLCTSFDLVACFRRCLLAVRFLGWDEDWIGKELNGYAVSQIPPWREAVGSLEWVGEGLGENVELVARSSVQSMPELQSMRITVGLWHPVAELVAHQEHGFVFGTGNEKRVRPINKWIKVHEIQSAGSVSVKTVLNHIAEKLFDYVSKAVTSLRFGQVVASAFHKYQASVDPALAHLGIETHIKTVYQNLVQDNPASWQAAVMACRNIMHKLSEALWQSPDNSYSYLPAQDGSPMNVTRDKVRNRIRAYLHQKGLKRDDMLMNIIDPLYSMTSAGKHPISYEHAQSALIHTYIFLGEMIRLTDMQPITEMRKI